MAFASLSTIDIHALRQTVAAQRKEDYEKRQGEIRKAFESIVAENFQRDLEWALYHGKYIFFVSLQQLYNQFYREDEGVRESATDPLLHKLALAVQDAISERNPGTYCSIENRVTAAEEVLVLKVMLN